MVIIREKQGKLNRYARLMIARARLKTCRTLINSALAEIIGNQADYSSEYLGVQVSFDHWLDEASLQIAELEKQLTEATDGE